MNKLTFKKIDVGVHTTTINDHLVTVILHDCGEMDIEGFELLDADEQDHLMDSIDVLWK